MLLYAGCYDAIVLCYCIQGGSKGGSKGVQWKNFKTVCYDLVSYACKIGVVRLINIDVLAKSNVQQHATAVD